jgi:hypothetical protein
VGFLLERWMAGDWIKIQHVTPGKPEVFAIAAALGIEPDAVLGKLIRIWVWADQHTVDGHAPSVTFALLDHEARVPGFAEQMMRQGWLAMDGEVLTFTHFDRHNGETAKTRGLSTRRQQSSRNRHADSVTKTSQQRDQRREEKRRVSNTNTDAGACENLTPQKPESQAGQPSEADTLVQDPGQPAEPIVIPDRMKTPEILGAARKWFRHLGQVAPERVPQPGSEQLREFWRHYGSIGPERFVKAVDFSIARGYKNLIEERPEYEGRDLRGGAVGSASPAQRREANNAAAFTAIFGSHPNDWPKPGDAVRREADRIHHESAGDVGGNPRLL